MATDPPAPDKRQEPDGGREYLVHNHQKGAKEMQPLDRRVKKAIADGFLRPRGEIEAALLVGSTAFKRELEDWDDFDLQIYTRSRRLLNKHSHYEILNLRDRHHLISAYYMPFDPENSPKRTVEEQDDVSVLLGSSESLRQIRVDRPRRIEPLPRELRAFETRSEVAFNILVDIFFILNRYDAKGRPNATKPRVARDGLRTISRHFYRYYGIDWPIPKRARWRKVMRDTVSLLQAKGYASTCQNSEFARAAIGLIMS